LEKTDARIYFCFLAFLLHVSFGKNSQWRCVLTGKHFVAFLRYLCGVPDIFLCVVRHWRLPWQQTTPW